MKLGIDIGSVNAKVVLTSDDGQITERYYRRTGGQPVETLLSILKEMVSAKAGLCLKSVTTTGSGGKLVSQVTGADFINEIIAHATATGQIHPEVRTIIEIGGEDSKLIEIAHDAGPKTTRIQDFSTNTMCAAGTGSFLDQQASRLGVKIEEFGMFALKSAQPPRLAGRCSVFAKTDMIHLQQIGTPVEDILAALCFALMRNFKSNVAKGIKLVKPVAFQGGVAANQGMVRAIREVMEVKDDELIIPDDFALMGAIGAVLFTINQPAARTEDKNIQLPDLIEKLEDYLKHRQVKVETLEPLSGDNYPINVATTPLPEEDKVNAYVGVDVGSISTNVVIIDKDNNVLARRYLMTAGRPIEAVRKGLYEVGQELGDKVMVRACGSTGSGRYMTGAFFGADVIKNEITSHAQGAVLMDPQVDTIFEIGGQDAKYISINNGAIVDFAMNKVCAAGTGSFLEEQAEKLAVAIDQEFGSRALAAPQPIDLGERCTVFMESQLNYYKQQGISKDNLLAGLAYSVIKNYLNKVVEKHRIGERIFFQGGTAYNRSVKAAFEKILKQKVSVPPQHDIIGAFGVAAIARDEQKDKPTKFKGFDLSQRTYQSESFECQDCPNNCEIRKVTFEQEAPLFYGSRCGKYDAAEVKKARTASSLPHLFRERERKLLEPIPVNDRTDKKRVRVGIPRTAMFFELYPLWQAFFHGLGFETVLSDQTNKAILKRGVENVIAEPCFPIKAAHGHILNLLDKEIDYLFLPAQITMPPLSKVFDQSYTCPYVQTLPYTTASAIPFKNYKVKILRPAFYMERGKNPIVQTLTKLARAMGVKHRQLIKRAIHSAFEHLDAFNSFVDQRGREIVANLKPNQKAIVVIGRPYNTCDKGITLDLPERLRELGIPAIPLDFMPMDEVVGEISKDYPYMYWKSGQRILAVARIIARDPRLFALYVTNFGCGPDSYINKFFEHEMKGKPYLTLEIDEHSSDVGIMTRCEAFLDTIKQSSLKGEAKSVEIPEFVPSPDNQRTIYIPYMDDHGYIIAAAIRAQGIRAEALPESNEQSLELGRQHTSGKECYPSIITTGDILKKVLADDFNPDRASFFMPSAKGPCRFGQYNKLHRMVLDSIGLNNVPMMMFDQTEGYHKDVASLGSARFKRLAWRGIIVLDLMQKMARETRPYELDQGETDKVYKESLARLTKAVEAEEDTVKIARQIRKDFDGIKTDRSQVKPKIGVVGEIYVRSNPFSNDYVVRKLERLGAEVSLPPLEEWIDYIDYLRKGDYRLHRDYRHYLIQRLTEFVQETDANKVRKEFKGAIRNFYLEAPTEEVIEHGSVYIDKAIRGEVILSMGRAVEYVQQHYQGIVNIIPFGCMPGNVVQALLRQFTNDYTGIPAYTLIVDGVKDPGEDMRIEAFVRQCLPR